jgi:alpha-tubulin suppressor-like RCC1 family protein
VWCWGYNGYGQIGDGTTTTRPVATRGTTIATAAPDVACGSAHTCVRLTDNTVRCWGRGTEGQLGNNAASTLYSPVTVLVNASTALASVSQLTANMHHTCARLSDGTVRCWGWNAYGQIGDNTFTNKVVATPVVELRPGASSTIALASVASISSGHYHTCVTLSDLTVRCWGRDDYGEVGDAMSFNRATAAEVVNLTSGVTCSACRPAWRAAAPRSSDRAWACARRRPRPARTPVSTTTATVPSTTSLLRLVRLARAELVV